MHLFQMLSNGTWGLIWEFELKFLLLAVGFEMGFFVSELCNEMGY